MAIQEGVRKFLRKYNPQKASGPDEIASVLTATFKKSIESGVVPKDWRQLNILAIFKKGRRCEATNYRAVLLTSLSGKLLEHIIVSSEMKHLEFRQILTDCQHGFR